MTAVGLEQDRIRTLVSMATDSSHRVIMGKSCDNSSSFIFDWFFFIIAGNKDIQKSRQGSKYGEIGPGTYELAALELLEKSP